MKMTTGWMWAAMSLGLAGLAGGGVSAQRAAPPSPAGSPVQTRAVDGNDDDIDITVSDTPAVWRDRPFLLMGAGGIVSENGSWGDWGAGSTLRPYALAHPGRYIVFAQGGTLRRLDAPHAVAAAERLHEPLQQLSEVQRALAAQQEPLAAQQRALSSAMHAVGSPADMGRIGREQGRIGARQGEIGREQGAIGRQQGVLGRAFYTSVQGAIDDCLQKNACPALATEAAAR